MQIMEKKEYKKDIKEIVLREEIKVTEIQAENRVVSVEDEIRKEKLERVTYIYTYIHNLIENQIWILEKSA